MQEIKLSPAKIITGITTAVVTGAIIGALGFIRISDATVLRVTATEAEIRELKDHLVPRSEWDLSQKHLERRLDSIESKIDRL